MKLEAIIYFLFLIDSFGAVLAIFLGAGRWYIKTFPSIAKLFPPSKGWALYYLFVVLVFGWLLMRLGAL